MGIETELKLRLADRAALRARLATLGGRPLGPPAFEDNWLLDDVAGRLRARGELLRLRRTGGRATLAWKGPKRASGGLKVREEIESPCGDGDQALELLERLGYRPTFRYQKFRETWELGPVQVLLDETPLGEFVEIEGEQDEVRRAAAALDLDPAGLDDGYPTLLLAELVARGGSGREVVFDRERLDRG